MERNSHLNDVIDIPDVMFNPGRLMQRHFYDSMMKCLISQPMQQVDDSISKGVNI